MCFGFLVALGMIGFGLIHLLAPNFAWWLTEFGHEISGVNSKRTELWDRFRLIRGIGLVVAGLFALLLFSAQGPQRTSEYKAAPTNSWITPTPTECPKDEREIKYIDDSGKIAVMRMEFCK